MDRDTRTWRLGEARDIGSWDSGTWTLKKDTRSRICTLRGDTRSWTLEEGHCEWRLRDVH